jgi:hypothetical protein
LARWESFRSALVARLVRITCLRGGTAVLWVTIVSAAEVGRASLLALNWGGLSRAFFDRLAGSLSGGGREVAEIAHKAVADGVEVDALQPLLVVVGRTQESWALFANVGAQVIADAIRKSVANSLLRLLAALREVWGLVGPDAEHDFAEICRGDLTDQELMQLNDFCPDLYEFLSQS